MSVPGAIITTTVWACKIYGGSVLSFPFANTGPAIIKLADTNIENRPRIPSSSLPHKFYAARIELR